MKTITLKNGEELLIREGQVEDAQKVIEQIKKVGYETDFLSFAGDEFNVTVTEEEKVIKNHLDAENQILLVAIIKDDIVAVGNILSSQKARLRHVGELGISVSKEHWSKGIGKAMITYMLDWAKASNIMRKINLSVNSNNSKAIKIYENLGFKHEGKRTMDVCINAEFVDGVLMGIEV